MHLGSDNNLSHVTSKNSGDNFTASLTGLRFNEKATERIRDNTDSVINAHEKKNDNVSNLKEVNINNHISNDSDET